MDDSTRDSGGFSNLSDSGSRSTTCGGVPRSASSKHGRRRPERPRLGASVDVEARQKIALFTVQPRRSSRRRSSVPSRGVFVPELIGVAGDNVSVQLDLVHRSTAHSTRARGSVRTSFSSSLPNVFTVRSQL